MVFPIINNWINKHALRIALIFTIIISISATLYYYSLHLTVEYSDAASHLDISRRVTDSLTPGIVQIGAAWLPFLHLLEVPLSTNYFLWHTGLSGSIISMICFLLAALGLFRLVEYITNNRGAALIGVIALVTNGNFLYLQTSAMFEPVLIFTLIWSTYFFVKWFKEEHLLDLLSCAFFVLLATMTRYDGWFLCIIIFVFIFAIVYKRYGYKEAEGKSILYGIAACLGIILWFIYNKVIFGSATYFLNGPYSSRYQQQLLEKVHELPAKGDILLSIGTYITAGLKNEGIIVILLLFIGIVIILFNKRISTNAKIALIVILSPFYFNIISLFFGESVIWIPQLAPFNHLYYNIRYGVLLLPAAAFVIGVLAASKEYIKYILLFLVIIQGFLFFYDNGKFPSNNGVITLRDARDSYSNKNNEVAVWLASQCNNKYILMSAGSNDPIMYHSGIDLKYYISEGSGKYWHDSMVHPAKYAQCVVYSKGTLDRVYVELKNYDELYADFILAKSFSGTYIYIKKPSISSISIK